METNNAENKIQYIIDEDHNLVEMPRADARPVENPIKYRLKNAFEVFVLVDGTENYWISNYGRCVNNLNRKDKSTFYEHKQGKVHYTLFEIERFPLRNKKGKLTGKIEVSRYPRQTSPEDLVADVFLESYRGRCKIWHKDGDDSNNWYKNLFYVTKDDYNMLKSGQIKWKDLNYEQEYIEYENKASAMANKIYYAVRKRCSDDKGNSYHVCYDGAEMCQEWLDNPQTFVKWYLEHYYEVGDESMAIDKDLFGNGSKVYSPTTCCILPQTLNTLLTNCKKPYDATCKRINSEMPYGVRYDKARDKYYAEISMDKALRDEQQKPLTLKLRYRNTPEEAFSDYKKHKEAYIIMMTDKYINWLPVEIYDALVDYEVEPY